MMFLCVSFSFPSPLSKKKERKNAGHVGFSKSLKMVVVVEGLSSGETGGRAEQRGTKMGGGKKTKYP